MHKEGRIHIWKEINLIFFLSGITGNRYNVILNLLVVDSLYGSLASLVAQRLKHLPLMWETWV